VRSEAGRVLETGLDQADVVDVGDPAQLDLEDLRNVHHLIGVHQQCNPEHDPALDVDHREALLDRGTPGLGPIDAGQAGACALAFDPVAADVGDLVADVKAIAAGIVLVVRDRLVVRQRLKDR
jgi:hypothetical protein